MLQEQLAKKSLSLEGLHAASPHLTPSLDSSNPANEDQKRGIEIAQKRSKLLQWPLLRMQVLKDLC